jgi:hypothetical protein
MLLGSFSTACSDVVVDSLVVERARGEPAVSNSRPLLLWVVLKLLMLFECSASLATEGSSMSWNASQGTPQHDSP